MRKSPQIGISQPSGRGKLKEPFDRPSKCVFAEFEGRYQKGKKKDQSKLEGKCYEFWGSTFRPDLCCMCVTRQVEDFDRARVLYG
jgi:hypothetical protein